MIIRFALPLLLLLTSQAFALSCMFPTAEERAAHLKDLLQGESETETLVTGVFNFQKIIEKSREDGNEGITALWIFEGERHFGGNTFSVSMPVEVNFWCWQSRCNQNYIRVTNLQMRVRLTREQESDIWQLYLGECSSEAFPEQPSSFQ